MDTRLTLMEDDKEKLVDEILCLRDENENLRQGNETLRQENEALRKKIEEKTPKVPDKKMNFVKDRDRPGLPPHRWGRKGGHKGVTRAKPDHGNRGRSLEIGDGLNLTTY